MIPTTARRSPVYTGTGAVFVYAFGFKVFLDTDVQVVVTSAAGVESTLTLGVDYTVTRNADQASFPGGTINLISALALSAKLVVIGATSYAQTTQLPTGGNYNATIVEGALDRIVMQVQQLVEFGQRTVRLPTAEAGPMVLPALVSRASQFLACDASGNIIAATGASGTAISVAMTPVVQSATLAAGRAALGATTVGGAVFTAVDALTARTTLGMPGGVVIDRAFGSYTANADLTTVIPGDDTIPQNTEGTQIISVAFTPKSATSRIRLRFQGQAAHTASGTNMAVAIFTSASANALVATAATSSGINNFCPVMLETEYVPGSTAAITFSVRAGPSSGTMRFNGTTAGRFYGGASAATLVIEEITP